MYVCKNLKTGSRLDLASEYSYLVNCMKMITVLLPGSHSVATRESNWEIPLRSKGVLEEGGGGNYSLPPNYKFMNWGQ